MNHLPGVMYMLGKSMSSIKLRKIIIARHYGICMGVERAISIAEKTMKKGKRVTILNEIVHNDAIVERFAKMGVGRSTSIDNISSGTIIISAHGASPEIFKKARERGLTIVDATCPLVIRIHKIIKKLAENGYNIIHFGDPEHDETIGIVGHAPDRVAVVSETRTLRRLKSVRGKLALTSQTTAHAADFTDFEKAVRKRYPHVEVFNTICNATNQRQAAIMELAPEVDLMLVVGSRTSANSKRLAQISKALCVASYLIDSADDIKPEWLSPPDKKVEIAGLSAGASTPDFLIEGVIERLEEIAGNNVEVVRPTKKSRKNRLALQDNIN
jgi:4-hydroxy-3-methylbut-2-enyl diphosphate reductase